MYAFYKEIQAVSEGKRKAIYAAVVFFIVFEAIWIFPLKYEISLLNGVMVYVFFMAGFLLRATKRMKWMTVFVLVFSMNMAGLGLRAWLEWGEASMAKNLHAANVFLTYLPIAALTLAGYLYTERLLSRSGYENKR